MSGHMSGQRETATEGQTYTFQELVVLLVGSDMQLVIVPFQNLLGIGKNGGDKFFARLHAMTINVIVTIHRNNVLDIVERLGIAICHAGENLEEEEVKVFVSYPI